MPDISQLQPFTFPLEGGLVLNKSTFAMQPGECLELENFEPAITGGYRRINGYQKWASEVVPFTTSSAEHVLMSAFWKGEFLQPEGRKSSTAQTKPIN